MLCQYIRVDLPKSPYSLPIYANRSASTLYKQGVASFSNLENTAYFTHYGTHYSLYFRKTGCPRRDHASANATFLGHISDEAVSYTHLRAHETPEHLVCRL